MQKMAKKTERRKENINELKETVDFKVKSHKVQIKTIKSFKSNAKLPGLKDFWKVNVENEQKNDDEEKNVKPKGAGRLTGSERYRRYMDEEERLRKIEEEMENPNFEPHTPDHFERELLKDKNNSFMWIKYMAFHLETAEIDKARSVAKKAIASINFREEQELLNMWTALLNLEIRYGSDETYNDVLSEATQRNNPIRIYSQTLRILLELEKNLEANKILEIMKRKFKPYPEMWLLAGEAYLRMNDEKHAKELLPKSLLSLVDKDHLEFMTKFALLMSRFNVHDFSQTIFEKILTTYPRNLSIWFTYIDMMTKNEQIEIARSLFDRMLSQKLPIKKLKSVFQKYIEFETKHGDSSNISKIKKIAKSMMEENE